MGQPGSTKHFLHSTGHRPFGAAVEKSMCRVEGVSDTVSVIMIVLFDIFIFNSHRESAASSNRNVDFVLARGLGIGVGRLADWGQ